MLRSLLLFAAFLVPFSAAQAQVVVSIKPLHSLVFGVAEGSGIGVTLLVDGQTSLHEFSLRPVQVRALHSSPVVFYMSDEFEQFLAKILPQLPAATKRVPLEAAKGLKLYPVRVGKGFEAHAHDDEHEAHHEHENHDMHAWLSPANARVLVVEIVRVLTEAYPNKSSLFAANAKKMDAKLAALDADLRVRMAALKGKPFATFHDATQYFDRAYGLKNIGAITLHPENGLGAKRVSELRKKIKALGAVCVFREPEFEGKIIDNLLQGTQAQSGLLDAEATLLAPSADLYFKMMEGIAASMETCLK